MEPIMLKDQKWTGDKLYCSVSFGNAITVKGCVVSRDETGVVLDFPKYKRADDSFIPLTVFHRTLFMKAVSVAVSCYETLSAVFSNNQKED
jgi:hypothetical protein